MMTEPKETPKNDKSKEFDPVEQFKSDTQTPEQKHEAYGKLSPRGKMIVRVGAALLRLADGLDRSHANVVRDLKCRVGGKDVKCLVHTRWDAQLELWGAKRKRDLFQKVFKRDIVFEVAR